MKKKILTHTVIAALLTLTVGTQASCGIIVFNGGTPDTTVGGSESTAPDTTKKPESSQTAEPPVTTSPEDAAKARLEHLPGKNLGATAIVIATADTETICPTVSEEDSAVKLSRAESTRAVEEKFSATIISTNVSKETFFDEVRAAHKADMFYADLLAIPQSMLGQFQHAGMLANLYSLPFVDFTAEYYDQSLISAATAGDALYGAAGAATLNADRLPCVFVNLSLLEKQGVTDIYDIVKNGEWTLDKMAELSRLVSQGEGGITVQGASMARDEYIDLLAMSMNMSYTDNAYCTVPTISYLNGANADRTKDIINKLAGFMFTDKTFDTRNGAELLGAFDEGGVLFMADTLSAIDSLTNSKTKWGVLPMPKYDPAQDGYMSPLSSDSPIFCVLENTRSYETSALILEGLNAASHNYILDTYITSRMNYNLRDDGSIKMLELITSNPVYDFSHLYASGINRLSDATYTALIKAVTTRSTINSLYNSYKNTASNALNSAFKVSN